MFVDSISGIINKIIKQIWGDNEKPNNNFYRYSIFGFCWK
jgi:hypothetical protein